MNEINRSPNSEEVAEIGNPLGIYWQYWSRGFWAWLLSLLTNLVVVVFILPIPFVIEGVKGWYDENLYYFISAIVVLIICIPIGGWLFEKFAKHSKRF